MRFGKSSMSWPRNDPLAVHPVEHVDPLRLVHPREFVRHLGHRVGIIAGAPPRPRAAATRHARRRRIATASHVAAAAATMLSSRPGRPAGGSATALRSAATIGGARNLANGGSVAPLRAAMPCARAAPAARVAPPPRRGAQHGEPPAVQPEFNNSWLGSRHWLSRASQRCWRRLRPEAAPKRVTARREEKRLARRAFREEVAPAASPPTRASPSGWRSPTPPRRGSLRDHDALTATLVGRFRRSARGWAAGGAACKGGRRVTLGGLEFRRGDVRAAAES